MKLSRTEKLRLTVFRIGCKTLIPSYGEFSVHPPREEFGDGNFQMSTPKAQLAVLLLVIYLTTTTRFSLALTAPVVALSVGSCVVFDLLWTFLKRRVLFLPLGAIVTGLIVGLVIDPQSGWFQIASVAVIAMAVKVFVRISGRQVFNPAAAGFFVAGVLWGGGFGWWGISFQRPTLLNPWSIVAFSVLLLPALISFYRLRRVGSGVAFLVTDALLIGARQTFLNPTTLFFATVMLPEPMTSPVRPRSQVLYGITIAILTVLLSTPPVYALMGRYGLLPDILTPALLVGNLLFVRLR